MSKDWGEWCVWMAGIAAFFFGVIFVIDAAGHTWRYFPYQAGAWLIGMGAGTVAALIRRGWFQ